jgi:hypothetical protein
MSSNTDCSGPVQEQIPPYRYRLCLSAKAVYCSRQPARTDTNGIIALTPKFSLVCHVSFYKLLFTNYILAGFPFIIVPAQFIQIHLVLQKCIRYPCRAKKFKLPFYRCVVGAVAVVIIGLYHETFNLKKTGHICHYFDKHSSDT